MGMVLIKDLTLLHLTHWKNKLKQKGFKRVSYSVVIDYILDKVKKQMEEKKLINDFEFKKAVEAESQSEEQIAIPAKIAALEVYKELQKIQRLSIIGAVVIWLVLLFVFVNGSFSIFSALIGTVLIAFIFMKNKQKMDI